MYKIVLDQNGKMSTFCLNKDAVFDGIIYHDAPEGFDPNIHSCEMSNGNLITVPLIVLTESAMQRLINSVKTSFLQKEKDGKDYFENKRAELFLSYKSGKFTLETCLQIEDTLKPVKDRIITGDWLSGQAKVKTMTSTDSVIEPILRTIESDINNYILNNYTV